MIPCQAYRTAATNSPNSHREHLLPHPSEGPHLLAIARALIEAARLSEAQLTPAGAPQAIEGLPTGENYPKTCAPHPAGFGIE